MQGLIVLILLFWALPAGGLYILLALPLFWIVGKIDPKGEKWDRPDRLSGFEPLPVFAGRFGLTLRCSPWKYRSIPCGLRLASAKICSAETAKHL